MNVGVYCSSSNDIAEPYRIAAEAVGMLLGRRGDQLVFGGGSVGLMGVVARATHEAGGRVFGVMPKGLRQKEGIAYNVSDEMVVTQTMQERKALIFNLSEAFLVLPGGFGTLEEFFEVLTLKNLGYHDKPLVLLNTDGFYDPMLGFFEHLYREKVARERYRKAYIVAQTPEEAISHLDTPTASP